MNKRKIKFKNLYELAEFLIQLGETLKALPNIELIGVSEKSTIAKRERKVTTEISRALEKIDAFTRGGIDESTLKNYLNKLTVKKLRLLCKELNIPIKKARKSEIIEKIIRESKFIDRFRVIKEFK
ncbi:MAG: hypothetical protein ACP6IQ_07420 [Candidatus Njordarchaeia archaeon]